jgi:hypothetical protein
MASSFPQKTTATEPETIEATFRNGSLTSISVVLGFSLSFVGRWASLPGTWDTGDLAAVALIVVGIILQIKANADLLSVKSLLAAEYNRSIRIFMYGLGFVAVGIAFAIVGDIFGFVQRFVGS